jgi:rhamnosyltransferase subunit B
MRVLLVCMGSMGDTLPFVAVGRAMRARGHRVTLIGNGYFQKLIEREGLEFAASVTAEEYAEFLRNQEAWSGAQAIKGMGAVLLSQVRKVYDLVTERYCPGQTIVCAQGYAFGARIAQELHGIPLATVHLQPMWFRSIYDPPGPGTWFPRWFLAGIDRLIDWSLDRGLGRKTNLIRSELGLPPAHRVMKVWWNSPQLVMGLFPAWFNPPQPDWPPNVLLPGFPILETSGESFDMTEVDGFLARSPPIVFTQSSVTVDAHRFFQVSIEVARRLGRRAILITPHVAQVPQPLPEGVRHFAYVPFEKLLPRSAAHVHHGGMGTIAHTLCAGVPQVTVPWVYDQTDNSQRLARLGVSACVSRERYRASHVVAKLGELLDSQAVAHRCADYAQRCRQTDALGLACQALERLEGTDRRM